MKNRKLRCPGIALLSLCGLCALFAYNNRTAHFVPYDFSEIDRIEVAFMGKEVIRFTLTEAQARILFAYLQNITGKKEAVPEDWLQHDPYFYIVLFKSGESISDFVYVSPKMDILYYEYDYQKGRVFDVFSKDPLVIAELQSMLEGFAPDNIHDVLRGNTE